MPGKADKPTQNSAIQGISEQENFMIRVLFICHGNISGYPKESVSAIFFVPKPVHNIILYDGTMKRTKSRRGL